MGLRSDPEICTARCAAEKPVQLQSLNLDYELWLYPSFMYPEDDADEKRRGHENEVKALRFRQGSRDDAVVASGEDSLVQGVHGY